MITCSEGFFFFLRNPCIVFFPQVCARSFSNIRLHTYKDQFTISRPLSYFRTHPCSQRPQIRDDILLPNNKEGLIFLFLPIYLFQLLYHVRSTYNHLELPLLASAL